MQKDNIIKQEIQMIIDRVSSRQIQSNVYLTPHQLNLISQLNKFCTNKILNDTEVSKDPRKISYKANQELKIALISLCLTIALTDHRSKNKYNKEFFEDNILAESSSSNVVSLYFKNIEEDLVQKAISSELIFDWLIYRDEEGRGIYSLINEKMNCSELEEYNAGGCPIYEFARFQRKYHDYKKHKENKNKESAQEAFRNAIAQQVATQITTQQLLSGQNPMDFVNMLFGSPNYDASIAEIVKPLEHNKNKHLQITHKKHKKKRK